LETVKVVMAVTDTNLNQNMHALTQEALMGNTIMSIGYRFECKAKSSGDYLIINHHIGWVDIRAYPHQTDIAFQ
jgi:hypothetical protein